MRILFICIYAILLNACTTPASNKKLEELNKRVELLEQKIESLESGRSYGETGSAVMGNSFVSRQCQGITKKGKPCKRKAKSNGYCWQHGG